MAHERLSSQDPRRHLERHALSVRRGLRRKILDGLAFFLQAKAAWCVLTPATRWRSSRMASSGTSASFATSCKREASNCVPRPLRSNGSEASSGLVCWTIALLEQRGNLSRQSHQFVSQRRINLASGGNSHELDHDTLQALTRLHRQAVSVASHDWCVCRERHRAPQALNTALTSFVALCVDIIRQI
jgi:hypothetical protein